MSNELAIPMNDLHKMATALAESGMFGFKTPQQAFAIMLVAQAQGIPAAQACVDFDLIQGKPAMTARAMLARFQQSGGIIEWTEYTDDVCEATFTHKQCPKPVTVRWTMDDAKRAGLTGKDNWKKYPRQMLSSRVMSEGVDRCYPAASGGFYPPEVVQDFDRKEKNITPTDGAEDRVSADRLPILDKVESEVRKWLDEGSVADAVVVLDDNDFDADEKVALWKRFDSKQRSAMKKEMAAQKAARLALSAPETNAAPPPAESEPGTSSGPVAAGAAPISDAARKRLEARISEAGAKRDDVKAYVKKTFGKDHFADLTKLEYDQIDAMLDKKAAKKSAAPTISDRILACKTVEELDALSDTLTEDDVGIYFDAVAKRKAELAEATL